MVGDAEMESHLQSLLAMLEPVRAQSPSARSEEVSTEGAANAGASNNQDLASASNPESGEVEAAADPQPGETLEMLRNRSDR